MKKFGIQMKLRWILMFVIALILTTVSNISARAETTTNDSIAETNTYSIDSEKPVIDANSITFSATSGTVGDSIKISMKITDNVGVSSASLWLYCSESGKDRRSDLSYNTATGLYEYSFDITENTSHGHWYIMYIFAHDLVDNTECLSSWEHNAQSFTVCEPNEDVHKWDNGHVLEQATCSKTGLMEYNCTITSCNASKTKIITINPNNHTGETEIKGSINPTCEKEGYTGDTYCKDCEKRLEIGNAIPATGHRRIEKRNNIGPTCEKEGYTGDTYCKDCEKRLKIGNVIPATGHHIKETIIKNASCTEKGKKQLCCILCDYKKEEEIPSKGHEFKNKYCTRCGKKITGVWIISGTKWWYRFEDGSYPTNQWEYINGKWYWFDNSGWMLTGWQYINDAWYYMNGNGAMLTDWQYINGAWYYMNGNGAMLTGWQYIGGAWYYMNGNGAMLTGWQYIGGKWYYFYSSGNMAANTWIGNCYVNSSGTWI